MKKIQNFQVETISIPLEIQEELEAIQDRIREHVWYYETPPENIKDIYPRLKISCLAVYMYCKEKHGVSFPEYIYPLNDKDILMYKDENTEFELYFQYLGIANTLSKVDRYNGWRLKKKDTFGDNKFYSPYSKIPEEFPFEQSYIEYILNNSLSETERELYTSTVYVYENSKLEAFIKYASHNKVENNIANAISMELQNIENANSTDLFVKKQGSKFIFVNIQNEEWCVENDDIGYVLLYPIHFYNLDILLDTAISKYGIAVSEKEKEENCDQKKQRECIKRSQ